MFETAQIKIPVDTTEFDTYLNAVRAYKTELEAISKITSQVVIPVSGNRKNNARQDKTVPVVYNGRESDSGIRQIDRLRVISRIKRDIIETDRAENRQGNERNRLLGNQLRLLRETNNTQNSLVRSAHTLASGPLGVLGKLGIAGAVAAGGAVIAKKIIGAGLNLATAGTSLRTESRNLGVTAGQLQSWNVNYSPYGDPKQILSLANSAQNNPQTAGILSAFLGVNQRDIEQGNTNEVSKGIVRGLVEKQNQYGSATGAVLSSVGLGELSQTAQSLARVKPSELNALFANLDRDSGRLNVSDENLKKSQDAAVGASRIHADWTGKKLTEAAPIIGGMATAAQVASDKLDSLALNASKAAAVLYQRVKDSSGKTVNNNVAHPYRTVRDFFSVKTLQSAGTLLKDAGTELKRGYHYVIDSIIPSAHADTVDLSGSRSQNKGNDIRSNLTGDEDGSSDNIQTAGTTGVKRINGIRVTSDSELANAHNLIKNNSRLFSPGAKNSVNGIDLDYFTGAIVQQESHGNPNAVSRAGAMGLGQLMPATAKWLGVKNVFDPVENWKGVQKYLGILIKKYHGDPEEVAAAYNWGPGNLDRDIKKRGDHWRDGLKTETRDYLAQLGHNISKGTIIRIENYTGQNLSTSNRRASLT